MQSVQSVSDDRAGIEDGWVGGGVGECGGGGGR